jgi:hypothetical protein
MPFYRAVCLLLVLALIFNLPPAGATTVAHLSWRELAYNADFIGIVECVTAGGIVAEYRVIESWVGPPQGTRLRLRMAVNYWEPQFPTFLVGDKLLVIAYKSHDPTILLSTTSGGGVPLWWRYIPADYSLPLFQGSVRLPLGERDHPLGGVGSDRRDLESFKKDIQEFLGLSPAQRELNVLKELWPVPSTPPESSDSAQSRRYKLALELSRASSVQEYISILAAFQLGQQEQQSVLQYPLMYYGGAETLKVLRADQIDVAALKPEVRKEIVDAIQQRLDRSTGSSSSRIPKASDETPPSEDALMKMRRVLLHHPKDEQFYKVFEPMTRYDPGPVADYLVNWVNRGKNWSDSDSGYVLGSYFAHNCTQKRRENLTKLLKAKDDFIRVAGAVYLTFEDHVDGMHHLKELATLQGDPGAWAALVLAERGDNSAVPRTLEVLSTPGNSNMEGVPHRNLQKRLLVLLSNSADRSGIPQPSSPPGESDADSEAQLSKLQTKTFEYFRSWWQANQREIVLSDPWADILEKQKVD